MATTKKRRSRKERAAIAEAYNASGLSQQAYAKQIGIHPKTVAVYLKEAAKSGKRKKAGNHLGRSTQENGRFVDTSISSAVSTLRSENAELAELRALVKQQASIIARLL